MKDSAILTAECVYFEDPSGKQMRMLHPGIHPGLLLFEEIAEGDCPQPPWPGCWTSPPRSFPAWSDAGPR